jgi:hypothetical protein
VFYPNPGNKDNSWKDMTHMIPNNSDNYQHASPIDRYKK